MSRYVAVVIVARGPFVSAQVAPGQGTTMPAGKLAATVAAARRDRAARLDGRRADPAGTVPS